MFEELIDFRTGVKSRAVFSAEEMFRRLSAARELLAQGALDALILSSPASITYYSNLVPTNPLLPTLLLLTPERSITLSPTTAGGRAHRFSFGEGLVYLDADHLVGSIRRLLPGAGAIGVEAWSLPAALRHRLSTDLPRLKRIQPVEEALLRLRLVRSREEIDLLRRIAELGRTGYTAGLRALQTGMTEYELARTVRGAMLEEAAVRYPHLEFSASDALLQSGISTDGSANPPGAGWIQPGQILNLCCRPALAGYQLQSSRTLFLDYCEDEQQRLWDINCAAHRQALESITPGQTAHALGDELRTLYQRFGLHTWLTGRFLSLPGESVLGHETLFRQLPLAPGMCLLLTTELLLPQDKPGGGGYRETTPLLITADGCEPLSRIPFGLSANRVETRTAGGELPRDGTLKSAADTAP